MDMLDTIEALSLLCGASGSERAVREWIIARLPADKTEYTVDVMGNLLVTYHGNRRTGQKIMLEAHMDEVGVIVTYIEENGLLRFTPLGGISPAVLCGKRMVFTNGTVGVIGIKPIHLSSESERTHFAKAEDLYIDIGAASKAEAGKRVAPGDTAVFQSEFIRFGHGKIKGKALDDRAGCAMLLQLMQRDDLPNLTFVFTVQEEVGLRGAEAAAFTVAPDWALVVETTTAADLPEVAGEKQVCQLGSGPAVSFMDRATVYDPALYRMAMELAQKHQIPAQTKTIVAGGNDSGAVHKSRGGVKTLAVSLPCRYLHSPACVLDTTDIDAGLALLEKLIGALADA